MLQMLRGRAAPTLILGVVLLLTVLDYVKPGLLGDFSNLARLTIGVLAAASGVYIIYNAMQTRSKADDFIATFFALMLFAVAAYFGFGFDVTGTMSSLFEMFKALVPFLIAAASALTGVVMLSKRDNIARGIGIVLMIVALWLLVRAV
ncbi:MAG: hypothetical protein F7C38_06885 [Desulfurococcales archaeon]|nr:hypothetical protein [Desulfurococcales archaeon]